MGNPITPEELDKEVKARWIKAVDEIFEIHDLGLDDLLPDSPTGSNDSQAWQEWKRQQKRGPATLAGLIEAYRRGYKAGQDAKEAM